MIKDKQYFFFFFLFLSFSLTFGSLQALMCFSDVSLPLEDFSLLFSPVFYMEKCLCHLCLSPLETQTGEHDKSLFIILFHLNFKNW